MKLLRDSLSRDANQDETEVARRDLSRDFIFHFRDEIDIGNSIVRSCLKLKVEYENIHSGMGIYEYNYGLYQDLSLDFAEDSNISFKLTMISTNLLYILI